MALTMHMPIKSDDVKPYIPCFRRRHWNLPSILNFVNKCDVWPQSLYCFNCYMRLIWKRERERAHYASALTQVITIKHTITMTDTYTYVAAVYALLLWIYRKWYQLKSFYMLNIDENSVPIKINISILLIPAYHLDATSSTWTNS